jgi:predicted GNAT family acetyltransferase
LELMMGNLPDVIIKHNSYARRFDVEKDGHLAVLEHQTEGRQLIFTHAKVPDVLGEQGIGSLLARAGLDHARAQSLSDLPVHFFGGGYIQKHPEYQDLVK